MRVSWRNLDWVGEADRGQIEKRLAEIGGEGSTLLDRVDFSARAPGQPGAPFEVRISGNVAKNQITAVRRDPTPQTAFQAALEAFERSAISVSSARRLAPAATPLQPVLLQPVPPAVTAALVSRWRPDLSLPRLNLSLDPQALFARLAQPTRGAWRAASSVFPALSLRRVLARQSERSRDRDRAEALARMSWRERLAALAMWNEVEAAERWAREQVFAQRWRSELERGDVRPEPGSLGWRERLADLSLWNELEAAERWAREQVLARLRRGERELPGLNTRQLPEHIARTGAGSAGLRGRLANLSLWDRLEIFERRMRGERPRALSAGVRAPAGHAGRLSRGLEISRGLVRRSAEAATSFVRVPISLRVGAAVGLAAIGFWSFPGGSYTGLAEAQSMGASAYSAVAVPVSWTRTEAPFSAVAVPLSWEDDRPPYSAVALPSGTQLATPGASQRAVTAPAQAASEGVAYSAVALPGLPLTLAERPVDVASPDNAALRD